MLKKVDDNILLSVMFQQLVQHPLGVINKLLLYKLKIAVEKLLTVFLVGAVLVLIVWITVPFSIECAYHLREIISSP
jgi:hypothetical protein